VGDFARGKETELKERRKGGTSIRLAYEWVTIRKKERKKKRRGVAVRLGVFVGRPQEWRPHPQTNSKLSPGGKRQNQKKRGKN